MDSRLTEQYSSFVKASFSPLCVPDKITVMRNMRLRLMDEYAGVGLAARLIK